MKYEIYAPLGTSPKPLKKHLARYEIDAKLSGVTPKLLEGAVRHYARFGVVDNPFPDKLTRPLMLALHKIAKATFKGKSVIGSCMIHVAFKRRYGTGRAACLK